MDLLIEATRGGITVKPYLFQDSCELEGCYIVYNGHPFIYYSTALENDLPRLRCVLAEEIGHHYTSAGSGITTPHYSYRNRVYILKKENLALRWAANYLLPLERLLHALRGGLRQLWELAEYFVVTEEMVKLRLQMMDERMNA